MVVKIDVRSHRVTRRLRVGGFPVDVKLAPAGRRFYVANQGRAASRSSTRGECARSDSSAPGGAFTGSC